MEVVIISSIIVSLLVIISTTAIIMLKKSITNDYNDKVDNIVSQVNDSQKTIYDYTNHRDTVIQKNTQSMNKVSSNVDILQQESEINNNDIITLELQHKNYATDNDSNIKDLQLKIYKMPWDQQLLNTHNLQVTQKQQQLRINSLKSVDSIQTKTNSKFNVNMTSNLNKYSVLSNVVNSNFKYVSDNIKGNTNNFYELAHFTSNAFYGIQGNYIGNSNLVTKKIITLDENTKLIKDTYTPKLELSGEITSMNNTYNTYSNFSYTKIINFDERVSNITNTYVNYIELPEAIAEQNSKTQDSFAKLLASNLSVLYSNIEVINKEYISLPVTYATRTYLDSEKKFIQDQINTKNLMFTNIMSNTENNLTMFSNVSVKDFNASGITRLPTDTKIDGQDIATQQWVKDKFNGQSVTREWILRYWPQGTIGLKGQIGSTGPDGEEGLKGSTGSSGSKGETGSRGPEGERGPDGAEGPQGPIGLQGITGFGTDVINNVKFSQGWQNFPASATNTSEISNDITGDKKLMIVGNRSAGGVRKVGILGELNINGRSNNGQSNNGQLNVTGNFQICDSSGNCVNLLDEVKWE